MYSTTTIVKNSHFNGRYFGTHQRLDLAARQLLGRAAPEMGNFSFPTGKEIIHFEGTRGPDGLKRKSPGEDEPSHMWSDDPDGKGVRRIIEDYRFNLVSAIKKQDSERTAREAAWMAHMITDGMTPAHHFPLGEEKKQLMTGEDMLKVFGEPVKGLVHGRNWRETCKNNWKYWGLSGSMKQHVSYEYGVLILAASMPIRNLVPKIDAEQFFQQDFWKTYLEAVDEMLEQHYYEDFTTKGWTVGLVRRTREQLLPQIVKMIALGWYSAIKEAQNAQK